MKSAPAFKPSQIFDKFGVLYEPRDAEAPILGAPVRAAVHQWLQELNAEEELQSVGLEPRRTALLAGPPGCGKTTLAHHLAARLGVPMVLVNLSTVVSKWVGQSAGQINDLFAVAREQPHSMVLFLDEFDSIAHKRSGQDSSAASEKNAIVISLLQAIDRFPGTLIAATNRAADIDQAIWRRFGMHLTIDMPDDESRFAILTRYLAPFSICEDGMDLLTEFTAGASPALLRQLMEGIKRDLVLSPRFQRSLDMQAVFGRTLAAIAPHPDLAVPRLWSVTEKCLKEMSATAWPPERRA